MPQTLRLFVIKTTEVRLGTRKYIDPAPHILSRPIALPTTHAWASFYVAFMITLPASVFPVGSKQQVAHGMNSPALTLPQAYLPEIGGNLAWKPPYDELTREPVVLP
jgi:hypothetical protein